MDTEVRGRGPVLLGRERECETVGLLLSSAARGHSGAVVIRGEAGIGKSALLDFAAHRAEGFTVLRTTGVEAESDLAFAGLYGLVRPILERLDQLPERQSAALAGALGVGPAMEADRLLVSAAVLGVLAAASEERPVLCLVDDAQWLDKPSADALVFAARRFVAERIAILFGAREGDARAFEAVGLPDLLLSGLDHEAARNVLAARAAQAAPGVRERLLEEAGGNPLALLELPGGLSDRELTGREALPESLPLTPRLHEVFRRRIEHLPGAVQVALMIVAADDTGDVATVLRAAAELGLPTDALDPAEADGLIRISRGRVWFRHPLVRAAMYDGATLTRRRRAHGSLAAVLSGDEHVDRRAWHQAMATLTSDEDVAIALEGSGRRAELRSAHASAATAYLRAADLSTDAGARVSRLAQAAQAAWAAGQPDRARGAIEEALPAADGELRAKLLYLKGVIESRVGRVQDAYGWLLESAEITSDTSFRFELLVEATEAAAYAGELEAVAEISRRQTLLSPVSERDRFLLASGRGWVAVWAGDHAAAEAGFTDALRRASALEDPRALVWAADAALAAFGFGAGLPYANRAVELAREQGLLSLLPMALHRQATALQWNSAFDRAYTAAQEGYRLALEVGYGAGVHLATMAFVEAVRGRTEEARTRAQEALAIGRRSGSNLLADTAELTIAFVDLAAGKPEAAADRLFALTAADRPRGHRLFALAAVPDLVEVAARIGRQSEVREPLARYASWVGASGGETGLALLARCQALTGQRDPAEGFSEALDRAAALAPFERARTELLYGEWLRRQRRRVEARPHLRTAVEVFHSLGTIPWQERAEAELRATGETTRKRDVSTLDQLTPQEFQIATLVAAGMTNRDIAAQLYLSPRTIDYHLRKVFSKLGIASRSELVREDLLQRDPV